MYENAALTEQMSVLELLIYWYCETLARIIFKLYFESRVFENKIKSNFLIHIFVKLY